MAPRDIDTLSVLQIGCGNFGPTHLAAWAQLGFAGRLFVADPSPAARVACRRLNLPEDRLVADYRDVLDRVDLVDVLSPTDTHVEICEAALAAGKHVFVEKPLCGEVAPAKRLADQVARSERVLQVGFYFRFHPMSRHAKARIDAGALGGIRYLHGRFVGFKRARADSGAVLNDAIHFIDLANWLVGAAPVEVHAVLRDHFGRGMEDLVVLLVSYPGGVLANLEAGYIQPGRWNDNFVAGATATKEFSISGSEGAIEMDYHIGRLVEHRVRHELQDGLWQPRFGDSTMPQLGNAEPVAVVRAELAAFLDSVVGSAPSAAGVTECGVLPARIVEAVFESGRINRPVAI